MARLQVGINDLETLFPKVAKEWHPQKNESLRPREVGAKSPKIVWWLCEKGHSYRKSVEKRTARGQNCPICRLQNRSLENVRPELLIFWDYEKNAPVLPSERYYGSEKKAWWICEKGHSYQQKINAKSRGCGCPICSHQVVSKESSLAGSRPTVAALWHQSKNGALTPYDVLPYSHKKVWWRCEKGHEYQKSVYSHQCSGCPTCDSEKRTSFPEQAILYYLEKLFPVEGRAKIGGYEADIFCPTRNVVIEYDGEYYHRGKESIRRERDKNSCFVKRNILLIRVKERKEKSDFSYRKTEYGYCINAHYTQDYLFLKEVIATIVALICGAEAGGVDVDTDRDRVAIINRFAVQKNEDSFMAQKPLGARKWDYDKNGAIDFRLLPKSSKKKYWWKCPTCGNEWYGTLDNVVNSLTCNRCARQVKTEYAAAAETEERDGSRLKKVANSLENQNPDLAKEWHPTRNGLFKPSHVTPKSGKRVWWLCPQCGYEFLQIVKTRNNGVTARKCPKCANNQKKERSSGLVYAPHVYAEWNYEKNGEKRLTDYTPGSNKKVWWRCGECGLEYFCPMKYRQTGKGCPSCGKKKASAAKCKKVVNADTGEVFSSVKSAAKRYGIKSNASISQCLKGKSKTAGGYKWNYCD